MSRPVLFGVPVDCLSFTGSVERCVRLIESHRFVQHVVLNAGKVVLMHDDEDVRRIVAECGMVNADGQSVVWAGRALGVPFPERVTGIDLMEALLGEAAVRGWAVYFLGAKPHVLQRFVDVVRLRYPDIRIAGYRDGYDVDDLAAAADIAASGARVLFVAMPSPRKEQFLSQQGQRLGPLFAMGVGGSFDVWAGEARRAPVWMQRSGLEWLYRLVQEPSRMWRRYLIGNGRFVAIVVREWIALRRRDGA